MASRKSETREFYPPRLNSLLTRLLQSISPLMGYFVYRMALEVEPESLERLEAIRGQRMLLLPNHPTLHDWIAIFLLSTRFGEVFHFLAAYERFQGIQGWLLQQMGAYSIRRGLGDRASISETLKLLMQPDCRLVIFPEGGCSFQNDTVMPFRVGAVQLALQALNRAARQGEPLTDLYAVPISIKYRYVGDMTVVIDRTLRRLERRLNVPSGTDFYQRLRTVAEQVLTQLEVDYAVPTEQEKPMPWDDRINRIRIHVLQQCEQQLDITPAEWEPIRERVYRIRAVLESKAGSLVTNEGWTYDAIEKATARLLNFDAIYDGYVAANPTSERFLDTLTRLERAVFEIDQPVPKGSRKALIHVGEPVNLKNYFADYQQSRSSTVEQLAKTLRGTVQANLDRLNQQT